MSTPRRLLAAAVVAAAACALAGCGAGTTGQGAAVTATTPPAAPSSPAATAPITLPATVPPTANAPAAAPAAGTSPTPLRSTRCTSAVLSASLTQGDGGAAGSILPFLVLTNTGTERCTLQGFPGVSFVGHGNGTQIGAAGVFDRASPNGTVTLDPGKTAHAPLKITQAANYPQATCQPLAADGLRVYPPGETRSLFVAATGLTACQNASIDLISVQALLPGS
jgi:hypothetical protein